jgi:hypothetical protein
MVSKTVEVASSSDSADQRQPFVFVVTYLPLKSWMKIIPFIRLSGKVEKQLRSSRGSIRYALKTDIPHKKFWTLSVWENEEDMALFSRSEPHRTAMKKFYYWGTDKAAIAQWAGTISKIDWEEAIRRLEKPMFHYRYEGKRLVHAADSKSVSGD